ncbi:MAG: pyrroline-5-carboxylate reductase [Bacteroidales bacterium]|nr:pyrroline-5-carboxylate reductase [Bacteroidales bacterium]
MNKIAILGGGNIGQAIAKGLLKTGQVDPGNITITRRSKGFLMDLEKEGIKTSNNNVEAVLQSEVLLLAVRPKQLPGLLAEIKSSIDPKKHIIGSMVTAYSIEDIVNGIGVNVPVIQVMPNTAIAIGESMTCLAVKEEFCDQLEVIKSIFDMLGSTLVISESLISASTILGACGIAFFLRAIRAASQGGIQVGFHAREAQLIAAQVAKGAASLLLETGNHPEDEIDRVTTPRGCTIAGLNEMEHNGLSSALIKGIVKSYEEIEQLK